MPQALRVALIALLGLLPASRFKNAALSRFKGYSVAAGARVAPILLRKVTELEIGDGAQIGLGTAVNNMLRVVLGPFATIGRFNTITAGPLLVQYSTSPVRGSLLLGAKGIITHAHYVDCSGGVVMEEYSAIGGRGCTIFSHSMDIEDAVQRTAPVRMGRYAAALTNCVVLMGCTIGERVAVAAGAVVATDLLEPDTLYGGVPARKVKKYSQTPKFFTRTDHFIGPEGYSHGGPQPT